MVTGFALTKFDRALAQIDRVLAGELTLPVGGPLEEDRFGKYCWASWTWGSDGPAFASNSGYYCGRLGVPELADLCDEHHLEICGPPDA